MLQASIGLARALLCRGEFEKTIDVAKSGLLLARDQGFPLFSQALSVLVGAGYADGGRAAEAIPLLQVDPIAGTLLWRARSLVWLAEAHLRQGAVEQAVAVADDALALARGRGERCDEAYAERLLGSIGLFTGALERAERHYREGLRLASDLSMRPLVAHCHAGLASLYRRVGKPSECDDYFATATAMYREMGMTHWLEPHHTATQT